jgi:O-succinylbenzoic acid--CoA ligase
MGMLRGADLWLPEMPFWDRSGSFLLLNPGMPERWRQRVLEACLPKSEQHCVWLATSGTSGVLKLVALSRCGIESSARAVNDFLCIGRDDVWINPLPLFHVGGMGIVVRAALAGNRWVASGPWSPEGFIQTAESAGATLCSLVPTQVHDLVLSGFRPPKKLRAVLVGGGALADNLYVAARKLGWPLRRSYGLTEAASQVATERGDESLRGGMTLLPHLEARVVAGVLELRGTSLLQGWMIFPPEGDAFWEDPKKSGWYRTGDRVEIQGREMRVLGRVDDLVKIRGELVDVSALERELQSCLGTGVVVCVEPDERSGSTLKIIAESDLVADEARRLIPVIFPPYARPDEVRVRTIERTALGKVVRRLA